MGDSTSGQTGSRALLNLRLTPCDDGTGLPSFACYTGFAGYRPRNWLNLPPLDLTLPPPPVVSGSGVATSASPPSSSDWVTLSQQVVQLNPANALLWSNRPGTAAPAAAATLQFNLLFGGFDNHFQIGEYISGSGTLAPDAYGRSYSLSWGLLVGGNDLLVSGPLSFVNPQLQVGPNFANLDRPDRAAQIAGNISNFINFNKKGSALTIGLGGQIGYAYDLSSGVSAFSASLLLQLQLQQSLGRP